MKLDPGSAQVIAERFAAPERLTGLLGAGTNGNVYQTSRPSAIKIHAQPHTFRNELSAYRRLDLRNTDDLRGFAVPRLIAWSEPDLLIEMGIVQPPFLIDFGKCSLDGPPPGMPRELVEASIQRMMAKFEDRAHEAFLVYETLHRQYGIHHSDLSPANLRFADDAG